MAHGRKRTRDERGGKRKGRTGENEGGTTKEGKRANDGRIKNSGRVEKR